MMSKSGLTSYYDSNRLKTNSFFGLNFKEGDASDAIDSDFDSFNVSKWMDLAPDSRCCAQSLRRGTHPSCPQP